MNDDLLLRLQRLNVSLCERLAAASECLGRAAERNGFTDLREEFERTAAKLREESQCKPSPT